MTPRPAEFQNRLLLFDEINHIILVLIFQLDVWKGLYDQKLTYIYFLKNYYFIEILLLCYSWECGSIFLEPPQLIISVIYGFKEV